MRTYLVKWELDISAESPREAVEQAVALLRSDEKTGKVFKVVISRGHGAAINLRAGG